jgi:hypothetical protein
MRRTITQVRLVQLCFDFYMIEAKLEVPQFSWATRGGLQSVTNSVLGDLAARRCWLASSL